MTRRSSFTTQNRHLTNPIRLLNPEEHGKEERFATRIHQAEFPDQSGSRFSAIAACQRYREPSSLSVPFARPDLKYTHQRTGFAGWIAGSDQNLANLAHLESQNRRTTTAGRNAEWCLVTGERNDGV